jgi:S1-C subfamily serine protease
VLSIALLACLAPVPAFADAGTDGPAAPPATPGQAAPSLPTAVPGVVDVVSRLDRNGLEAAGTGIVLANGEVVTNNHVINGALRVRVNLPGRPAHRAVVLGADPTHDVALLAVRGPWAPTPATLGASSTVAVGDPVEAIGNAGGVGVPSIAGGFITGRDQSLVATDENGSHPEALQGMLETDADIQPGDSGGPLLNAAGQVIGMDTAGMSSGGGAPDGYAIPIDTAMAVADGFPSNPATATATPAFARRHSHGVRYGDTRHLSRGARGRG